MSVMKPFFQLGKATLQSLMWLIWTIRIVMLLGFIFVVICIVSFFTHAGPPEPQEAPYYIIAVTTDNLSRHVYYSENVLDNGTQFVLVNYWRFNGEKYGFFKGEKPLVKADWGDINIYRR